MLLSAPIGAMLAEKEFEEELKGFYDEDQECWIIGEGKKAFENIEVLNSGTTSTRGADTDWERG